MRSWQTQIKILCKEETWIHFETHLEQISTWASKGLTKKNQRQNVRNFSKYACYVFENTGCLKVAWLLIRIWLHRWLGMQVFMNRDIFLNIMATFGERSWHYLQWRLGASKTPFGLPLKIGKCGCALYGVIYIPE